MIFAAFQRFIAHHLGPHSAYGHLAIEQIDAHIEELCS